MRILLTSDLHLKKDRDERLQAFVQILKVAKDKKVDRIIIAGDLFDSPGDARRLRPDIRKLLAGNKIPIMAIPGNHDHDCYEENLDFGDNFVALVNKPLEIVDCGNVRFVGVPYFEGRIVDVITDLITARKKKVINILILHGSLDLTGFSRYDFGEEKEYRYLPITDDEIKELKYNYILAGHFHTEPLLKKVGRTTFIYPGSPVVISKREVGRRYAYLVDTEGDPAPVLLKTHYYQPIEITIHPGKEKANLIELKKLIGEHDQTLAELKVTIRGFVKVAEKDFQGVINMIAGDIEVDGQWRQVSDLVSEPLYNRIQKRLAEADFAPELKAKVEEMLIEAMIQ